MQSYGSYRSINNNNIVPIIISNDSRLKRSNSLTSYNSINHVPISYVNLFYNIYV